MTEEKTILRTSNAWYIWAAISAAIIVVDMVAYGVRFFNIWPAVMTLAFAFLTFSGRRVQNWVITYYQGLPPRGSRANIIPLARRYDLLSMVEKTLWALWLVLLACALAFQISGNSKLSDDFNIGMIILLTLAIPIRVFAAGALFWPASKD